MKRQIETKQVMRRLVPLGVALAVLAGCSSSDDDSSVPVDDGTITTLPGTPGVDPVTGLAPVTDPGTGIAPVTDPGTGVAPGGPVIEPAGSTIAPDAATLLGFLINTDSDSVEEYSVWRCQGGSGFVEYEFESGDPQDTSTDLVSSSGYFYDETRDYWTRFNIDTAGNDALMYTTASGVRAQDKAAFQGATVDLSTIRTGPDRAWSAFDSQVQSAISCTETTSTRQPF